MRLFWSIYLRITGWKIRGSYPYHLKKCVVIVAPHTSAWDFIVGLAVRSVLRLERVRFLGKEELFRPPFGFLFRWLGGYPVDRFSSNNMVDAVVKLFNSKEEFAIAMSPEGTRKRVDKLRTGFYYIALNAHVPIVMGGLDFGNKQVIFSDPYRLTGDVEEDMKVILDFFRPIRGKIPAYDLSHL